MQNIFHGWMVVWLTHGYIQPAEKFKYLFLNFEKLFPASFFKLLIIGNFNQTS